MGDGGLVSSIILIVLLVLVMAAAYFTTKYLSVRSKRLNKGKYLELKDQMHVGRDKHIVMLKAGEQVFLVGVTNQSISLIGTLKKEEIAPLNETVEEEGVFTGFKGFFGRLSGVIKNANNAQEELRKARLMAKVQKEGQQSVRNKDEQDEIDKILQAMQQRKGRDSGNNHPQGDGK